MDAKTQTLISQAKSGKIKSNRQRVLRCIMRHPHINAYAITENLNLPWKSSTARISELLDMGVIEVAGTQPTTTGGALSLFVFQPDPAKQEENARRRIEEKYRVWKGQAVRFGEFLSDNVKEELQII